MVFVHLEHKKPSLILLDYYLDTTIKTSMTGENALLKLNSKHPEIPVIFLTGTSDKAVLSKIAQLPIQGLIHKDEDDVLEKITEKVLELTQ